MSNRLKRKRTRQADLRAQAAQQGRQPAVQNRPPVREVAPGSGIEAITRYLPKLTNPDEVARQKGLSYYASVMMQDSHVAAEMTKRVLSIVNKPVKILPAPKRPETGRIAEFVRWNFEEYLDRGWNAVKRQVMEGALVSGVSVNELIWEPVCPSGPYAGFSVLKDVKYRDPERFLLDNQGNVYLKKDIWDLKGTLQRSNKFLVFAWQPEYENPYGTPILRSLRWHEWFKRQGMTYWMIFLEKFSQPTVIGKYPSGATKEQKDMLQAAIESVQVETGIRIPDTMTIEFLEAARSGEAGYQQLKDACNREISKVISGQTLTTEAGKDQGSTFALGYVHNLVRQDINLFDCQELDRVISNHLIPPLVDYNFTTDAYPRHKTTVPLDDYNEDRTDSTQTSIAVAKLDSGRPDDENEEQPRLYSQEKLNRMLNYAQVTKIQQALEDLYENALEQSEDVYKDVWGFWIEQVKVSADKPEDWTAGLENFLPDTSEYVNFMLSVLLSAQILGLEYVQRSMNTRTFEQLLPPTQPLTVGQAARYVESKKVMSVKAFKKLTDDLKRISFTLANREDVRIQEAVKTAIADALRDQPEMSLADLERLARKTFLGLGLGGGSTYHAETVFRTNIQSAFNDALYKEIRQREDEIAFLRFRSHKDGRVRDAHRKLDGVTLTVKDFIKYGLFPPLGFNCRCWVEIITYVMADALNIEPTKIVPYVNRDIGFSGKPGNWVEVLQNVA